ncbi:MAG: YdiU family protein [Verrucomicrobia bacterium]|nr:MAG: YdiU family protein [Verrucomicrobiota bacterium]
MHFVAPPPAIPPATAPAFASAGWRLEHTYASLPAALHIAVEPAPVATPRLVVLNGALATTLGLDPTALAGSDAAAAFAGNLLPPGAAPLAQAYSGHQYGGFTTLGDGRAILLGEQITPNGARLDIQLKGSGPTPFSRRGDGRAALGPMLREYILGEAMHALGIPTTRGLAVVSTGEIIARERPRPGAVLVRVAASHIRVGTFEGIAARGDERALHALIAHTLDRHYPDHATAENPALALLAAVIERQASLIAQWMLVGFVHGVMNTDNLALSGETIDYGPCAFIEAYDPAAVFSSIDRHGRYAYGNQPSIARWNLTRLAEALLPAIHPVEAEALDQARAVLATFAPAYERSWLAGLRAKLGLVNAEPDDAALGHDLLEWMHAAGADFTNTFAALVPAAAATPVALALGVPPSDAAFAAWRVRWAERLARQPLDADASSRLRARSCPAVIPRNHQVELVLAAAERGEFSALGRLLAVLVSPFDHTRAEIAPYREPAPDGGAGYQTFCGT